MDDELPNPHNDLESFVETIAERAFNTAYDNAVDTGENISLHISESIETYVTIEMEEHYPHVRDMYDGQEAFYRAGYEALHERILEKARVIAYEDDDVTLYERADNPRA